MSAERGELSLVGLLVAMTLFLGVMGATLTTFGHSETINRRTQQRADAQDKARTAGDAVVRELRNVLVTAGAGADPVPTAHDLVARQVDAFGASGAPNTANTSRVRFCLDDAGVLWRMQQTWTTATAPAAPSTAGCPGTGWAAQRRVVSGVRNKTAVPPVATFAYDAPDPSQTSAVRVTLVIDEDPARAPGPVTLSSGVFFRNQNKLPVAAFAVTANPAGGVVMNASGSQDPEGEVLTYAWRDAGAPITGCSKITCSYDPPGSMPRTISLEVTDFGGAKAVVTQVVTA